MYWLQTSISWEALIQHIEGLLLGLANLENVLWLEPPPLWAISCSELYSMHWSTYFVVPLEIADAVIRYSNDRGEPTASVLWTGENKKKPVGFLK